MGAETITTRRYLCNTCGKTNLYDNDCDAGKAGWALLDVNGNQYALCREHYDELKAFLNVDIRAAQSGRLL